jgi:hypothetical protein
MDSAVARGGPTGRLPRAQTKGNIISLTSGKTERAFVRGNNGGATLVTKSEDLISF